MLKKLLLITTATMLITTLTACRSAETPVEEEPPVEHEWYVPEDATKTPEQIRADFELFFADNSARIIRQAASGGEEIHLELGNGNEFIMTILLDDIELDDENRALYSLAFSLSFSDMEEFFFGLATEIMEDAGVEDFLLTVVFADVHGEEIARSRFSVSNVPLQDSV